MYWPFASGFKTWASLDEKSTFKADFEEVHGEGSWGPFLEEYKASYNSYEDELSLRADHLGGERTDYELARASQFSRTRQRYAGVFFFVFRLFHFFIHYFSILHFTCNQLHFFPYIYRSTNINYLSFQSVKPLQPLRLYRLYRLTNILTCLPANFSP